MTSRNALALVLTVVSIGLLIPGLTKPVLTIVASISMLGVSQEIFLQTQSVWRRCGGYMNRTMISSPG